MVGIGAFGEGLNALWYTVKVSFSYLVHWGFKVLSVLISTKTFGDKQESVSVVLTLV